MCALFTTPGLSLFSSFSTAFGGREKKRVVNVFHNKVFRLDAPPKTTKQNAFLCVKKDAKKRERDSLFPSSTFYGLVKSHVSDRSVSLSMDPHSRKKPLPFPPKQKTHTKKTQKIGRETRRKCAVETSSQNEEALFRRFYIERRKGRRRRTRPVQFLSLSRIILISSRSVKRTRETTSFYLLGRGRGRDTRPSAATLENDDDDDNDDGDDARRRESVFVEVVDATMEEDDDGDGPCNYYI